MLDVKSSNCLLWNRITRTGFKKYEYSTKDDDQAVIPSYSRDGDAGVDLISPVEKIIKPREIFLVDTGIRMQIPIGYEAQIRPRSGLALKHGITVLNSPGTVDCNYRGRVGIILVNNGMENFEITKGMKIAQMVFKKVEVVQFEEVSGLYELSITERGENGFGSSGYVI